MLLAIISGAQIVSATLTATCDRAAYQSCNFTSPTVATGCTTAGLYTGYTSLLSCATASGCLDDLSAVNAFVIAVKRQPLLWLSISATVASAAHIVQLSQYKKLCGNAAFVDPHNATVVAVEAAPSNSGWNPRGSILVANIGTLVCCLPSPAVACSFAMCVLSLCWVGAVRNNYPLLLHQARQMQSRPCSHAIAFCRVICPLPQNPPIEVLVRRRTDSHSVPRSCQTSPQQKDVAIATIDVSAYRPNTSLPILVSVALARGNMRLALRSPTMDERPSLQRASCSQSDTQAEKTDS